MFVSLAPHKRFSRTLRPAALAARVALLIPIFAIAFAAPLAQAQGTHLWTQSRLEEFEKGTPQGVAITSDGRILQGPDAAEVVTTPSTFVWSVAVDAHGTAFLGTASPATVLRVAKDGKIFKLFETKDVSVQVVRLGPDGSLYAATLPSGKVYKLKPDATTTQDETSAQLIFDSAKAPEAKPADAKFPDSKSDIKPDAKSDAAKPDDPKSDSASHFIWDLTFDSAGNLYVATGGPAAIYRVGLTSFKDSTGGTFLFHRPELFFKSDEQHIRCLAWDPKGNLIAGTDGSGLIYRIDPTGKGYVLFEAPRREITSLAIASSGAIYAASVGDKSRNPLPPLPVQGASSITITIVQPSSLTTANTSASVPEGSEIYLLTEGQAPRKIWSTKDEVVYALAARKEGLLALTGNRGHIFQIADDGSFSDVAHLEAQQALTLAVQSNAASADSSSDLLIGTGNTGKLYRLSPQSGKHEYASDVLDAGALSRFGRIEVEPGSSAYELFTRSGNVEQPVRGWSDWVKLNDNQIASPAGRFFQWKAALHDGGSLGSVGVNYLPINAAPVIEDLVVVPGARLNPMNIVPQPPTIQINFPSANAVVSFDGTSSQPIQALKDRTAITVRWAAHDDNGDDLKFSLFIRGDGEQGWRLLKDDLTDKAYSFDATLIPDGGYRIKLVASDAPSHTPAEALTAEKESDRFEIDTTAPIVSNLKTTTETITCKEGCSGAISVTFEAEDAFSPIARAEYSIDAGPWQYVEPVGNLSDSRREHYDVHIPAPNPPLKPGEHLITVRAYDRHDNIGVAKTLFSSPPSKGESK
jgi:sugar lactone lactonase YvrE